MSLIGEIDETARHQYAVISVLQKYDSLRTLCAYILINIYAYPRHLHENSAIKSMSRSALFAEACVSVVRWQRYRTGRLDHIRRTRQRPIINAHHQFMSGMPMRLASASGNHQNVRQQLPALLIGVCGDKP